MILIQQSRFADHRVTEIDRIQTAFKHLSWVICLCSALCTLKPKKPKNLKKNSKKPRFFPALVQVYCYNLTYLVQILYRGKLSRSKYHDFSLKRTILVHPIVENVQQSHVFQTHCSIDYMQAYGKSIGLQYNRVPIDLESQAQ